MWSSKVPIFVDAIVSCGVDSLLCSLVPSEFSQTSFIKLNSNPETRRLLRCHCSYFLRNTGTIGIPLYFNGYHKKNMIIILF